MRLLSVVGSPRKGRHTDVLADQVGRGFAESGGTVEKVAVADLDLRPCRGCFACMQDLDSVCAQRDDMTELYVRLQEAQALLWATPVYMWSPTAQMKLFLDRLFPFGDYQSTRWRCALKGAPVGLVLVYADPDPLTSGVFHAHAILDIVARASGGAVVGTLHTPASDESSLADNPDIMERAAQLGRKLAEAAAQRARPPVGGAIGGDSGDRRSSERPTGATPVASPPLAGETPPRSGG